VDVDIGNLINSVICFLSYMGASGYLGFIFMSVSPCKMCSLFCNDVLSWRVDFIGSSLYLSLWVLVISLRKLSFLFGSMLPVNLR
jgi:hypothetical protein